MSFKRQEKTSAYQIHIEDQARVQERSYSNSLQSHNRSYESPPQRRTTRYESPLNLRKEKCSTADHRTDDRYDRFDRRSRRSPGMETGILYKAAEINYDQRLRSGSEELKSSRYERESHLSSDFGKNRIEDRYWDRGRSDTRMWDDRSNDFSEKRDCINIRPEKDYVMVELERNAQQRWDTTKYSDSDDECLHESLRRKQKSMCVLDADNQPTWASNRYNLDNYAPGRKRKSLDQPQRASSSLSPPVKVKCRERQLSHDSEIQNSKSFRAHQIASETLPETTSTSTTIKKKKTKVKRNFQMKDKKRKATNTGVKGSASLSNKRAIPSLMDLEFPPSIKSKNLEETSEKNSGLRGTSDESRYVKRKNDQEGEDFTQSRFKGHRTSHDFDDSHHYYKSARDSEFRRHDSDPEITRHAADLREFSQSRCLSHNEYDRRLEMGHSSRQDTFGSSRNKPHEDARSISRINNLRGQESVSSSGSRRNRLSTNKHQESHRGTGRPNQERSHEYHEHSDSDQDSDKEGARRSWREERRDRQPKKKDLKQISKKSRVESKRGKKEMASGKKCLDKNIHSTLTIKSEEKKEIKQKSPELASRFLVLPSTEGLAVLMTHGQEVCLRGRTKLCVLAGTVSILGYNIKAHRSRFYNLYSPTSSSLLAIHSIANETDKKVLRKSLKMLNIEEKEVKEFMDGAVILMARRLNSPMADFISTLPPFTQLFKFNLDRFLNASNPTHQQMAKVGVAFFPLDQAPNVVLKTTEDFNFALKKWTTIVKESAVAPVALLCGGVNTGKSTLGRFMINSALGLVPKICFLDCDTGQTEFSPPGCITLTFVDKPVLGPPFCHQQLSESMCFYGMTSPADGPTRYIQCVQHVFRAYRKLEPPLPLIVNTMGWNEGLGLKLFVDTLNLTTPDLIIQIDCANQTLNFPAITTEYLALEPGWLYNTEPVEDEKEKIKETKKHELVIIESLVTTRYDANKVKLTPKNQRDLSLLAHLVQGLDHGVTLTSAIPYALPWSKFGFHVCHSPVPRSQVLPALNASIVALCKADLSQATRTSDESPLFFDEAPVCDCLGYGLVRGFDTEKQVLYVVTGLVPERLAKVNTLMKGAISVPDQLFFKQANLDQVPYVDALKPATAMAPVRQRNRMPRNMPFSFK